MQILAPFIVLFMVSLPMLGQTTDTLRLPVGAAVQFVAEGGGRAVMVSGTSAYQRAVQDSVWTRLPFRPVSAALTYVQADTICLVDGADSVHLSTNGGRSWESKLGITGMLALVARGKVGVAATQCDGGVFVVTLYDIVADTVRYITSPIACSESITIVPSAAACWVASYGPQSSAALQGDVWKIDNTDAPIANWTPEFVEGVGSVVAMRDKRIGLCSVDTISVAEDTTQRIVLPYRAADLGYPLDVGSDGQRWWIVLQNGAFSSTNGLQWQRDATLSGLAGIRWWSLVSGSMLCTVEGFGPVLRQGGTAAMVPHNQGLIDPVLTSPLCVIGNTVAYADTWTSISSRGMVVWGEDVPPAVRTIPYGNTWQRRSRVHRDAIWTFGIDETVSYRADDLVSVVQATGQQVFDVVAMGDDDVIWQGLDLKRRRAGENTWTTMARIVDGANTNGQVLGLAGLAGRVVVVGLVYDVQTDAMVIRANAIDSLGEDQTGPRFVTTIPADASFRTFGVYTIDDQAVVWTGDGMFVSNDGGQTWIARTLPFRTSSKLTAVSAEAIVWAAEPAGIWRTTDVGQTWTRTQVPLARTDVRSVVQTERFYHALTPFGVIRIPKSTTSVANTIASQHAPPLQVSASAIHATIKAPYRLTLVDMQGREIRATVDADMSLQGVPTGVYHCIVTTPKTAAVTSVLVTGYDGLNAVFVSPDHP